MNTGLAKAALALAAVLVMIPAGPAHPVFAAVKAITDVPCDPTALSQDLAAAKGGEIMDLAPLCLYSLTTSLPAISYDLTIRGNDATVERSLAPAVPEFSLLTVTAGEVIVSGLSFRNGGSGSGGPDGGTAAGGAINNEGGDVTVKGGTFSGNSADYGGAIANASDKDLVVTKAVFTANKALNGGAIDNDGVARVSRATFTRNTATRWGGAIATFSTATITDCRVTGNAAALGGGMFTTRSSVVNRTEFSGNRSAFFGAAIFNDDSLALRHSHILANIARYDGGGIYNDVFGNATATGDEFLGNRAELDGGAIGNENVMRVSSSRLIGNSADQHAGGIYTDWVMTVSGSAIIGNVARSGGGIFNDDFFGSRGTLTMAHVVVVENVPDNCEGCDAASGVRAVPRRHPAGESGPGLAAQGVAQAMLEAAGMAQRGRP